MPDETRTRRQRTRTYDSPLRERQAQQTRDDILDALTALLEERPAEEITTGELARAAGVSPRTVYRHFPDRTALVDGLTARLYEVSALQEDVPERLEDLKPVVLQLMRSLDAYHVEARAEALYNADPRRYGTEAVEHTRQFRELITEAFPDLDEGQQLSLTATLRVLVSAQTWLRLREEFGLHGDTSGPLVAWAIDALLHEVERGNPPPTH